MNRTARDTVPAASKTDAEALTALLAGELAGLRDPQALKALGAMSSRARQYLRLTDRGWAVHHHGSPTITNAGVLALGLARLGLRGMTISQARLLLAVSRGDVVTVGPDVKVRVNDRGRETYHLAPAVRVYLADKYSVVELPPGGHVWQLTEAGKAAIELLSRLEELHA